MEAVLQEFRDKTVLRNMYNDLKLTMKYEETSWEADKRENQDVLYNYDTGETVWKNPYYCWRFREKYFEIPYHITEWIQENDSVSELKELIKYTEARIKKLE